MVVNYHQRREPADEVVADIVAAGSEAIAVQADVSCPRGRAPWLLPRRMISGAWT